MVVDDVGGRRRGGAVAGAQRDGLLPLLVDSWMRGSAVVDGRVAAARRAPPEKVEKVLRTSIDTQQDLVALLKQAP
jgi:hypothetical protein